MNAESYLRKFYKLLSDGSRFLNFNDDEMVKINQAVQQSHMEKENMLYVLGEARKTVIHHERFYNQVSEMYKNDTGASGEPSLESLLLWINERAIK